MRGSTSSTGSPPPACPNHPLPGREQLCARRFLSSDSTKLVIRFENWINWIKIITDIFRQLSMTMLIGGHWSMVMRVRVMFQHFIVVLWQIQLNAKLITSKWVGVDFGCVAAGLHIQVSTSNYLFVWFACHQKCFQLQTSSSSTHTEEIFRNKAVALFPITKFDFPDLQIIPENELLLRG